MTAPEVPTSLEITLPDWVPSFLADRPTALPELPDRVDLVLDLAAEQVERRTGGPFAAAVFQQASGVLVAVGVNRVVPMHTPVAHAELLAFALAGQRLGGFDLGTAGPTELVASTEPCAMCLGATVWSGVERLVCCARDEDARAIGFDEGDKPDGWIGRLGARGIEVVSDAGRDRAAAILRRYAERGGPIYNSRAGRREG